MNTKPFLGQQAEIEPGEPVIIETDSADGLHGVVFEDDGETGYFYARDFQVENLLFVDALHIYDVKGLKDAHLPSRLRIIWSTDWQKSALLINDIPHAMFDFIEKCGYSRNQFPDPAVNSGWRHEGWRDNLREYFYPTG